MTIGSFFSFGAELAGIIFGLQVLLLYYANSLSSDFELIKGIIQVFLILLTAIQSIAVLYLMIYFGGLIRGVKG